MPLEFLWHPSKTMKNIRYLNPAIFLVALITLTLELTLMRVFDVLWYPNMAYMIITLAMFAFAFSGVFVSLRPIPDNANLKLRLALLVLSFGVFSVLILPVLNYMPVDFSKFFTNDSNEFGSFFALYLILALPFFLAGIIFSTIFSSWPDNIRRLYFWDLSGAAVGSVILIPILPFTGPGGILLVLLGLSILAAGLFLGGTKWLRISAVACLIFIITAFALPVGTLDFKEHVSKRDLSFYRENNKIEFERWDSTSKIDVAGLRDYLKIIFYDGGSQSSEIYRFDGNLDQLRRDLPGNYRKHFTLLRRLSSHAVKDGENQDVLIIGAAGGQEIKAALAYGAGHIDAVELVKTVVELGKKKYSSFNGNIFNHPKVDVYAAEGRSFLRATDRKYDIIQIFSNHTSSSIAAGTGAMATTYLQTAEAYEEYFTHLNSDGILQVNHHIYPKMIVTAAVAWKELGKSDFRKHVIVCEGGTLPTLLIKMSSWTADEIKIVEELHGKKDYCIENPFNPEKSTLSEQYYEGQLDPDYSTSLAYRADPSTDDKPYFNHLRKTLGKIEGGKQTYISPMIKNILDMRTEGSLLPRDVIHLFIIAAVSILAVVLFLILPTVFSRTGKVHWRGKAWSMLYFSCLGAGFIIFELVFIQVFMKLVGYPLYTYSAVVFGLLLAAGTGSFLSSKLNVLPQTRWKLPFIGLFITSIVFLLVYHDLFSIFLAWPVLARAVMAILLIFPMGLFMGMLFPLGILMLKDEPAGSIAWAWAMNGLFTVVGGLMSVVLSIYLGFTVTLIIALMIYLLGWLAFARFRKASLSEMISTSPYM
jgi:spermidine synthase